MSPSIRILSIVAGCIVVMGLVLDEQVVRSGTGSPGRPGQPSSPPSGGAGLPPGGGVSLKPYSPPPQIPNNGACCGQGAGPPPGAGGSGGGMPGGGGGGIGTSPSGGSGGTVQPVRIPVGDVGPLSNVGCTVSGGWSGSSGGGQATVDFSLRCYTRLTIAISAGGGTGGPSCGFECRIPVGKGH